MENVYKQQPGLFRLRALVIWEWLMVLPAMVLLAAAACCNLVSTNLLTQAGSSSSGR